MNTSVQIKTMVNHFLKFVCSEKSMSNCVCEVGSSSCSDLPVLSKIASRSPSLAFAIIVVVTWYSSSSTLPSPSPSCYSSSCTLPSPSTVHYYYNISTWIVFKQIPSALAVITVTGYPIQYTPVICSIAHKAKMPYITSSERNTCIVAL